MIAYYTNQTVFIVLMNNSRNIWMAIAWAFTFWIPTFFLELFLGNNKDRCIRWREKFTLFILTTTIPTLLIFGINTSRNKICDIIQEKTYTLSDVQNSNNLVIINGKVIHIDGLKSQDKIDLATKYVGKDLSDLFPTFIYLGRQNGNSTYGDSDIQKCINSDALRQMADNWLRIRIKDPGFVVNQDKLSSCPLPDNSGSTTCYTQPQDRMEYMRAAYGDVIYHQPDLAKHVSISKGDSLISLNGKVYNLARYLGITSSAKNATFLGQETTQLFLNGIGTDASDDFNQISSSLQVQKCLDKLFYAGSNPDSATTVAQSIQSLVFARDCTIFDPVLFGIAVLFLIVILPKYCCGFHSGSTSSNENLSDANVILIVKCYKEKVEHLRQTIKALLDVRYNNQNKLIVFICDGQDSNCNEILSILNFDVRTCIASTDRSYISVGEGAKSFNTARIYAGIYSSNSYIVIQKTGTVFEHDDKPNGASPGSRGHRDSLVLLLSFLSKLSKVKSASMTPFDYELFQILKHLQLDARKFEYALLIQGNTVIHKESVCKMVTKMDSEVKLGVLQGKVIPRTSNILRLYPFYIDNHLQSSINSAIGRRNIGILSGGSDATMVLIRLKYSDGTPLLLNSQILDNFSNSFNPPGSSMTFSNCFYKAEDKFLFASFLVSDTLYVAYDAGAKGISLLNDNYEDGIYYSYEKSKISDLSLKWYVINSSGCCEHIGTALGSLFSLCIPALTAYLYYLAIVGILLSPNLVLSNVIVVVIFVFPFILNILSSIVNGDLVMVFSVLLYLTVGIPIYNIIFPIIAIWNMDSCERKLTSEGGKIHGCIDPSDSKQLGRAHVPRYILADWEAGEMKGKLDQMAHSSEFDNPKSDTKLTNYDVKQYTDQTFNYSSSSIKETSISGYAETVLSLGGSESYVPEKIKYSEDNIRNSSKTEDPSGYCSDDTDDTIPMNPSNKKDTKQFKMKVLNRTDPKFRDSAETEQAKNSALYYQPTNFEGKSNKHNQGTVKIPSNKKSKSNSTASSFSASIHLSPMRAASVARSDYESDFTGSVGDRNSRYNRNTTISERTAFEARNSTYSQITKEDIRDEIRFFLQEADLKSITRREVKEHLFVQFGQALESFSDFINSCIEEYTLEKLALL